LDLFYGCNHVPVQFDPYPVQVLPVVSLGKGWNYIGFS